MISIACAIPNKYICNRFQQFIRLPLNKNSPTHKKTLNHPIFIGNSRFFVDLHDNNTVQILMRTVRLCVHLSCNFCCKVLILFLKTFTSLETNESLKLYRCSNFFGYHLKILSNCLFVLSFYILLL